MPAYTLFGQSLTGALAADAATYTMGVQFSVSQAATLTAVWFYSAPGAANLPSQIALFAVSGASLITSQAAAWSGAAGSGWVRAPFTSPPALAAGISYKACIGDFINNGNFYSAIAHYWDTGAGQNGISNGPLSAPNNAGADHGQSSFHNAAVLAYPDASFNATNYLVDPEVTVATTAGGWPSDLVTDFILDDL